jgi:hypothetical protein
MERVGEGGFGYCQDEWWGTCMTYDAPAQQQSLAGSSGGISVCHAICHVIKHGGLSSATTGLNFILTGGKS